MSLKWDVSQTGLDAVFLADIIALLSVGPYDWAVTFAVRSYAEQAALYAKYQDGGPEAARPGESAHEFGLAVDVVHITPSGGRSWIYESDPAWGWLWVQVRASPAMHSGHDFPPAALADNDHIEAYRWSHTQSGQPSVIAQMRANGTWGQPPTANV
jgi:D-alanyl-D-alanine carboxypeptidase